MFLLFEDKKQICMDGYRSREMSPLSSDADIAGKGSKRTLKYRHEAEKCSIEQRNVALFFEAGQGHKRDASMEQINMFSKRR